MKICKLCKGPAKGKSDFCSKNHKQYFKEGRIVKWVVSREGKIYICWKVLDETTELAQNSFKVGVIDYPDAPQGKAYIGVAKQPLMANVTGFGFQGVLLQDKTRQYIQCSICGCWAKKLTTAHIKLCSKGELQTARDYKIKFGLYPTEGLVSDQTSLRCTEAVLKNKDKKGINKMRQWQKDNPTARFVSTHKKGYLGSIRQHQNKTGSCPEQLKERFKDFILRNHEFPTTLNKGGALIKHIRNKFGNLSGILKAYNLPILERYGGRIFYNFPSGERVQINVNRFDQRENFFNKMVMECDFFTPEDREFFLNRNANPSTTIRSFESQPA